MIFNLCELNIRHHLKLLTGYDIIWSKMRPNPQTHEFSHFTHTIKTMPIHTHIHTHILSHPFTYIFEFHTFKWNPYESHAHYAVWYDFLSLSLSVCAFFFCLLFSLSLIAAIQMPFISVARHSAFEPISIHILNRRLNWNIKSMAACICIQQQ